MIKGHRLMDNHMNGVKPVKQNINHKFPMFYLLIGMKWKEGNYLTSVNKLTGNLSQFAQGFIIISTWFCKNKFIMIANKL